VAPRALPALAPALVVAVAVAVAAALAVVAVPGCLPPDAPPPQAPAADPDTTALLHAWRVEAHLLTRNTPLTDADAARLHGRTVSIDGTGYSSPWQGTCEEAGRTERRRRLAEVAAELKLDRARVLQLGFADPLVEYRLSCLDAVHRAPSLTLYIANARALTCFSGACYVLVH